MTAQQGVRVAAAHPHRRWAFCFAAVAAAYFLVFVLTRDQPFEEHLRATARNAVSLGVSAALTIAVLKRWVLPLSEAGLWLAHAALAIAFSFAWLWLLTVAKAILKDGSAMQISVAPYLIGPAETWQLLQGLFAYVGIAALVTIEARPSGAVIIVSDGASVLRDRFLMRAGEGVAPLPASEIVSIIGADDYAELVTTRGSELVSTTLAEFETALDPSRFLRVHRSAIANLDHLVRAEPAGGGRMTLEMRSGPQLPVSRAGAKLLRERAL